MSIKQFVSSLQAALETGDGNSASTALLAGLHVGPQSFMESLKRKGTLRSSRYGFATHALKLALVRYEKFRLGHALPDAVVDYLNSVRALLFIADAARPLLRCIKDGIKPLALKGYLTAVDELFWCDEDQSAVQTGELLDFTKEDIAVGFSFYFAHTPSVPESMATKYVDVPKLRDGRYITRLENCAKIAYLKEAELLVDHYGYKAIRIRNKVRIEAGEEVFEKYKSLGYLRHKLQVQADYERLTKDRPTLPEFVNKLVEGCGDNLFVRCFYPERLSLRFPKEEFIGVFLRDPALLHDEVALVEDAMKQLFITPDEFWTVPLSGTITLRDLLTVRRLFAVMYHCLKRIMEIHEIVGTSVYYHSLCPTLGRDQVVELLALGLGERKAEEMLALLMWDSSSKTVFDLQTQPLIPVGSLVLLPLGVLAQSHLFRNILQCRRFRFDADGTKDPLSALLLESVKSKADHSRANLNYSYEGITGEVDCLIIEGSRIFVFECKNSLHPCNPFELRATVDHVRTAAAQLNKFVDLWREAEFRDCMSERIGFDLGGITELRTCILMGNRMFAGWREQGHPVRTIHELLNLLSRGVHYWESRIDPDNTCSGVKRMWRGETFSFDDLCAHLDTEEHLETLTAAMVEYEAEYRIGDRTLSFPNYALDMREFDSLMRGHPRFVLLDEGQKQLHLLEAKEQRVNLAE